MLWLCFHLPEFLQIQTTLVEGYTRARWEHSLTGKIVGDSGRVWDFGMSYAESSWMSEPTFYVARTYFGS